MVGQGGGVVTRRRFILLLRTGLFKNAPNTYGEDTVQRLIMLAAALLCFSITAQAQNVQQRRNHIDARRGKTISIEPAQRTLSRAAPMEAEMLPYADFEVPFLIMLSGDGSEDFTAGTVLTEDDILRRISRIYGYQAEMLLAEASGDEDQARSVLDLAMTDLSTLARQPGVVGQERFRELFRTVLGEYEQRHGPSDSLNVQTGDIFELRSDIFAALNDVETPLLEDVYFPNLQPLETVFPMTMNRLVESSIAYLLRSPDRHLFRWLSRAETYFPMVEQILREEGVPDELKYLAMIESGLVPTAQSWAAAGGMWQFIQATGRAYGLTVDSYVDERLDPEKATRAAARHLKDLHKMFGGDWQLALAGYNCSPSRIKRAMASAERRTGRTATFWDIYNDIPKETRNYVPMFIAAALVASNPSAFDLPPVAPGPHYEYELAKVPGLTPLSEIGDLAGVDVSTLRALNPELRKATTPAARSGYDLRMPVGSYARFAQAYSSAPPKQRRVSGEHVVKRGDTLSKIAQRYGVSMSDIKSANNMRGNIIRVNQRLTIPGQEMVSMEPLDLAGNAAVRIQYSPRSLRPIIAASTPSLTYEGTRKGTVEAPRDAPQRTVASTSTSSSSRSSSTTYKVRRGDSLGKIASSNGVSVSDLVRWNSLRSTTIRPGQRIKIYSEGNGTPVRTASYSASSTRSESSAPAATRTVYKVRRGDSLGKIAARHGVSISDLRGWNNLTGSKIMVGQSLSIYANGGPASTATSSGSSKIIYKVRRGDTLSAIAAKHGVSISDIKKWNKLRSSTIRSGQRLTIFT